jgi:transcriptional antiterminator RfaH
MPAGEAFRGIGLLPAAWYVAAIKRHAAPVRSMLPQLEHRPVAGSLAVMHLALRGFTVFFPTLAAIVIHRRTRQRVSVPMFPGYVFVEFDLDGDEWRPINSTIGVTHLLPHNSEMPYPVPDGFIDLLRSQHMTKRGFIEKMREFEDNVMVKIITGPFAAFEGRIENVGKISSRVRIFALTGQEFIAQVPNAALAKVENAGPEDPARQALQRAHQQDLSGRADARQALKRAHRRRNFRNHPRGL